MTPFLQFSFVLAVILLAAKLAGYTSTRFGQASFLGELLVGSGVGARLAGFNNREALQLGASMVSRGEVGLIIAKVELEDFFRKEENLNRTLFTVVETEDLVDRVVDATQAITGDLNLPQTGRLVVLPVKRAYGLNRKDTDDENPGR